MANLEEKAIWSDIYLIETEDLVLGGSSGVSNKPHRQLANRTLYLLEQLEGQGDSKTFEVTTDRQGWQRIATGKPTCMGLFEVVVNGEGVSFYAGCADKPLLLSVAVAGSNTLTQARIVRKAEELRLEVRIGSVVTEDISVKMLGGKNWTLVDLTPGSIPDGYDVELITFHESKTGSIGGNPETIIVDSESGDSAAERGQLGDRAEYVGDLDDLDKTGNYWHSATIDTHAPSDSGIWYVDHSNYDADTALQVAWEASTGSFWIRVKRIGVWSDWSQYATVDMVSAVSRPRLKGSILVEDQLDSGDTIQLPHSYIVGSGNMQIFYNGILLNSNDSPLTDNYVELGTSGEESKAIQTLFAMEVGSEIKQIVDPYLVNGSDIAEYASILQRIQTQLELTTALAEQNKKSIDEVSEIAVIAVDDPD